MRLKNAMLGMFVLLLLTSAATRGADIPIFPTGPVYRLNSLTWGVSTQPGFNNNYFFTPLSLNESVCVYVKNNNPTNPHTFTASIVVTPDASNSTPSDGTWQASAASSNLSAPVSPGIATGIGTSVSGVSQVSINLSASSTQAGNPDTANVTIIQTSGVCFAGNGFISSSPQGVGAFPPIQIVSDGLSQAFYGNGVVTNPTINQVIWQINSNNSQRTIYLDRIVISSTVAIQVIVNATSTLGTTCGSFTAANEKILSPTTSSAILSQTCAANPTTVATIGTFNIPASGTFTIDLRGFILPLSSLAGIETLAAAAATGTVSISYFWYEK
jgi:hypothetical protein